MSDKPNSPPPPASDSSESEILKPVRVSTWQQMKTAEDWWAIWCAIVLLGLAAATVLLTLPAGFREAVEFGRIDSVTNLLEPYIAKPGKWVANPVESVYRSAADGQSGNYASQGVIGAFVIIGGLFLIAMRLRRKDVLGFAIAFPVIFGLATLAYVLAGQSVIKSYNLEYALWALLVGLIISNTIGTATWLRKAVETEFYIKTGLVLLGAEVLMSRLMALGIPGVGVAWVVTPIVLISTYAFGQKVLKIKSKSLNMVISADMSVCGVSAAIATAASCKAKKEELSLAIGLSLSFTVVMMVVLPLVIKALDLPTAVGGAWLGGTIDATGAVAVAGATLGEEALEVAATVKMIQNILIGFTAFLVAAYWVAYVEKSEAGSKVGVGEIWYRFPKFVLGFIVASIVFSLIHSQVTGGDLIVDSIIKGSTKTLRGWFFCLAFVCIGLETNFKQLLPYFRGGKPAVLYVCGQSLNLVLTLAMAYLMFEVFFPPETVPVTQ